MSEAKILELDYKCNNFCRFCYHKKEDRKKTIPTQAVKEKLASKRWGNEIEITGGEPTIRKDILEIIKYAKNTGCKIKLRTNARMLSNRHFLDKIINAGVNTFEVAINGDKKVHDYLSRIDGAFDQTIQGMSNIRKAGKAFNTTTVLNRKNQNQIYEILEKAMSMGADSCRVHFIKPTENTDYLIPNMEDAAIELQKAIDKLQMQGYTRITAFGLPSCVMKGYEKHLEGTTSQGVKTDECEKCKFINECEGIQREYYKIKGFSLKNLQKTRFNHFLEWLKSKGYSNEIIDIYRANFANPILRLILNEYFLLRKGKVKHPADSLQGYSSFKAEGILQLNFMEVIPTDKNSEFVRINPGDVEKLRVFLEKRFGKRININHETKHLNHKETFETIRKENIMKNIEKVYNGKAPCIIHFDIERLEGQRVCQIWDITKYAVFMGKDYKLNDDINTLDMYAHEFGHNIGLTHQYVDLCNPVTEDYEQMQANSNEHVGIDDVMIKSKNPVNPKVGHFLSPLSRYALEPEDGYIDEEFVKTYNNLYSKKNNG